MKDRIAVVAINIFHTPPDILKTNSLPPNEFDQLPICARFKAYQSLGAKAQIDKMAKRIESICKQLKEKEPNSTWIIGWQEKGIFDKPEEKESRHPISVETKNYLIDKMKNLVAQYPQLIIKTGAVVVDRPFNKTESHDSTSEAKLNKLTSYFTNFQNAITEDNEFWQSYLKIEKSKQSNIKLDKCIVRSVTMYTIFGVPNPCNKNEIVVRVLPHRKSAPFQETKHSNEFFRPASQRTFNPILKFEIPDKKKQITIADSICREIMFDFSKTVLNGKKADIHFVNSNYIDLNANMMQGVVVIQFDSFFPPRLILTELPSSRSPEVVLYQSDLLSEDDRLGANIKPFFPLDFQVIDILNQAIKKLPKNKDFGTLTLILEKFMKLNSTRAFNKLQGELEKILIEQEKPSKWTKAINYLMSKPFVKPYIVEVAEKILTMIKTYNNNPDSQFLDVTALTNPKCKKLC